MDLNIKLINLESLYCSRCTHFLCPPIMLTHKSKNICGICYEEQDTIDGDIRNEALEDIIKFLQLPCRYSTHGCKYLLSQKQMLEHESKCNFKPTKCAITNCSWSGYFRLLKQHLIVEHEDSSASSDDLIFEFVVNIGMQCTIHRLLLFNTELFLLKLNVLINSIQLSMCHTNNNIDDKLQFMVEEVDDTKGLCQKLGSFKTIQAYNANHEIIDININNFKKLNIHSLNMKIKIYFGNEPLNMDSKLLKLLECTVCLKYMFREIYNCSTGHSICHKCRFQFIKCPTCDSKIENGQVFALQTSYNTTNVPCINRSFGCTVVLTGAEMKQHFSTCKYKQLFCKFKDCNFCGKYCDIVDHYANIHHVDNNQFTVKYSGVQPMEGFVLLKNVVNCRYWGRPISAYGHIFFVESIFSGNELRLNTYMLIGTTSDFQVVVSFGHERKKIIFINTFHDFEGIEVKIPLDYFTDLTDIYGTVKIIKL